MNSNSSSYHHSSLDTSSFNESLSRADAFSVLTELVGNSERCAELFPLLNRFSGKGISIREISLGRLTVECRDDDEGFIYEYDLETESSRLLFEAKQTAIPSSVQDLDMNKRMSAPQAISQLSELLGISEEAVVSEDYFPRLNGCPRTVYFNFIAFDGKLSVNADAEEGGFSFIYDYRLATGKSELVYLKEITDEREKIFAAWNQ